MPIISKVLTIMRHNSLYISGIFIFTIFEHHFGLPAPSN